MDDLDRAAELEIKQRQMALDDHFLRNSKKLVIGAMNCIECDDVIPSARRLAVPGCTYCVNCQALAERGKL